MSYEDDDFSVTDGNYDPATDPFEQEDEDENPEPPPDDDPGWVDTPPPPPPPPALPNLAGLLAFAANPPGQWTYEGYGTGGYVLSAPGLGSTVRFHVHEQSGTPPWTFGGMWIQGVDDLEVNINEDVSSKDGLRAAVAPHLDTILQDIRSRR